MDKIHWLALNVLLNLGSIVFLSFFFFHSFYHFLGKHAGLDSSASWLYAYTLLCFCLLQHALTIFKPFKAERLHYSKQNVFTVYCMRASRVADADVSDAWAVDMLTCACTHEMHIFIPVQVCIWHNSWRAFNYNDIGPWKQVQNPVIKLEPVCPNFLAVCQQYLVFYALHFFHCYPFFSPAL